MKPEDAAKRFETKFSDGTGKPRLVFELKYPENIKDPNELRTAELLYALHRPTDRFPRDGFLNGNVKELAISIQYARIDDVSVRYDPSGLAKKLWNMARCHREHIRNEIAQDNGDNQATGIQTDMGHGRPYALRSVHVP